MLKLTTRQTKALQRLMKKLDVTQIAFEELPNEYVRVYISDYSGRNFSVDVAPNGVPRTPQKMEFSL